MPQLYRLFARALWPGLMRLRAHMTQPRAATRLAAAEAIIAGYRSGCCCRHQAPTAPAGALTSADRLAAPFHAAPCCVFSRESALTGGQDAELEPRTIYVHISGGFAARAVNGGDLLRTGAMERAKCPTRSGKPVHLIIPCESVAKAGIQNRRRLRFS